MNFIQKIFSILVFVLSAIQGMLGTAILSHTGEFGNEYESEYQEYYSHKIAPSKTSGYIPTKSASVSATEAVVVIPIP